jgi:hypothetical protein
MMTEQEFREAAVARPLVRYVVMWPEQGIKSTVGSGWSKWWRLLMTSIDWEAFIAPPEPPADPQEAACLEAGGHYYLLDIQEGLANIYCDNCGLDPNDGYSENIVMEGLPVTVKIEVIHYPANPNHADEYDVFYEVELDTERL